MNTYIKWAIVILVLIIAAFLLWRCSQKPNQVTVVDCKNESLAEVMEKRKAGGKIIVKGTCEETEAVTITDDNVSIEGEGRDVTFITGVETEPVFKVIGARGVTFKGLTVQKGLHGIEIDGSGKRGADVTVDDLNAVDNKENGIFVNGAGEPIETRPGPVEPPADQGPQNQNDQRPKTPLSSTTTFDKVGVSGESSSIDLTKRSRTLFRDAMAESGETVTTSLNIVCNTNYIGNGAHGILLLFGTVHFNVNGSGRCAHHLSDNGDTGLYSLGVVNNIEMKRVDVQVSNNPGSGLSQPYGMRVYKTTVEMDDTNVHAGQNTQFGVIVQDGATIKLQNQSNLTSISNSVRDLFIGLSRDDVSAVECDSSTLNFRSLGGHPIGGQPVGRRINCQ